MRNLAQMLKARNPLRSGQYQQSDTHRQNFPIHLRNFPIHRRDLSIHRRNRRNLEYHECDTHLHHPKDPRNACRQNHDPPQWAQLLESPREAKYHAASLGEWLSWVNFVRCYALAVKANAIAAASWGEQVPSPSQKFGVKCFR